MATQRIIPTGVEASMDQWTLGGGSSKWAAMDPADANTFATSHINVTSIGTYNQAFTITTPSPRISITSWTTYSGGGKNANTAQTTTYVYDMSAGTRYSFASGYNIFIWGVHQFSAAWPSPTNAMIDSANLRFLLQNTDGDGSHPSYVDYIYADFVFVPAGESFISIWNLIAPFLGAGLLLKDMPRINTWLSKNTLFKLDASEYPEALRRWKGHKFTRYFDLRSKTWQMHALSLAA